MVSVDYIIKAALEHDTSMSRAFLRACGIPVAPMPEHAAPAVVSTETADEADPDIAWCFRNAGSPMEWRQTPLR